MSCEKFVVRNNDEILNKKRIVKKCCNCHFYHGGEACFSESIEDSKKELYERQWYADAQKDFEENGFRRGI